MGVKIILRWGEYHMTIVPLSVQQYRIRPSASIRQRSLMGDRCGSAFWVMVLQQYRAEGVEQIGAEGAVLDAAY